MMPSKHVVVSTVTSAVFFAVTKSWGGSLACFLSGIFIDLDHVVDYWIIRKKICYSYKKLMDFCLEQTEKAYMIFHSYELLVFLLAVVITLHFQVVWLGCLIGLSVHMFFDQVTNTIDPFAYFLFYRAKLGFTKSIFDVPVFIKETEEK